MMRVMNFEVFFMLYLLGQYLTQFFGPFRLLTSHLLLIGLGLFFGFLMVWYFLPKAFPFFLQTGAAPLQPKARRLRENRQEPDSFLFQFSL